MIGRTWYPLIMLIAAAGCDLPGKPRPGDRPVPPDQVLDFAALYGQNCAGCHGAQGEAWPCAPLNNPLFLTIVPDSVLRDVVAGGRPGTPMPAFARSRGGTLTDAQVNVLAAGIKPRWLEARAPEASDPPRYSLASKATGASEQGALVFQRACAGCHGPQGEGDVAGAINDRSFLASISDQAIRRYAITGRPDLGMPNFAGNDGRDDSFERLSTTEIDDLVALLAQWRKGGSPGQP